MLDKCRMGTEYEKEFIPLWLKLRDEKRAEMYKKKFMCDQAYFMALEFNDGGSKKIAQAHDNPRGRAA